MLMRAPDESLQSLNDLIISKGVTMNTKKSIASALVLGSVCFAASAFGADAVATKSAPQLTLFPNLTAKVDVRQMYTVNYASDELIGSKVMKYQLRPTLSNTWFDKQITTDLIIGVEKINGEGRYTSMRPELVAFHDFAIGEAGNLSAYADLFAPQGAKGIDGSVGAELSARVVRANAFGEFAPFAVVDGSADVNSKNQDRTIEKDPRRPAGEFGIGGQDSGATVVQDDAEKDPTYNVSYYVGLGYKMPVFTKWSATAFTRIDSTFAPEHKAVGNGQIETKYGLERNRWESVAVKYAANKKVAISNETRFFHNGLYQMQDAGARYHNRLVMTYNF